jgi:hypothetical protein
VIESNLIANNTAGYFGGGVSRGGRILSNTVIGNETNNSLQNGAGIDISDGGTIARNIVVGNGKNAVAAGVYCRAFVTPATVECNDSWGNVGPDYVLEGDCDTTGLGNISLDPGFCDAADGDYQLSADSPCAPDNSPCGLIGKYPAACGDVASERVTWGSLKILFSSDKQAKPRPS